MVLVALPAVAQLLQSMSSIVGPIADPAGFLGRCKEKASLILPGPLSQW